MGAGVAPTDLEKMVKTLGLDRLGVKTPDGKRAEREAADMGSSIKLLSCQVAGTRYAQSPESLASIKIGSVLRLAAEPFNGYDRNAVAVLDREGLRLGYVPADRNEVISALLLGGKEVVASVDSIDTGHGPARIGVSVLMLERGRL